MVTLIKETFMTLHPKDKRNLTAVARDPEIERVFNQFDDIYTDVTNSSLWTDMRNTSEASPWHREENVAVHTEMVLREFEKRVGGIKNWSDRHLICAIALLFHDVGKPGAREEHYSEERGTYYRFGGHELLSVRLFEDYMVDNFEKYSNWFTPRMFFQIGWLIQHHLPYNVQKKNKLETLYRTSHNILGSEYHHLFKTMVLSDQYGRTSDNHDHNKVGIHDWFDMSFDNVRDCVKYESQSTLIFQPFIPTVYLLIGAPGSGKSTWRATNETANTLVYSMDDIRLKTYVPDEPLSIFDAYDYAVQQSMDDNGFETLAKNVYKSLLAEGKDIIVDNTNLSDKRRDGLARLAVEAGFRVVCVLFPVSKAQLVSRAQSRTDHRILAGRVINMYDHLTYPSYSELYDDILVCPANLPRFDNDTNSY
jgi:predicted kinase